MRLYVKCAVFATVLGNFSANGLDCEWLCGFHARQCIATKCVALEDEEKNECEKECHNLESHCKYECGRKEKECNTRRAKCQDGCKTLESPSGCHRRCELEEQCCVSKGPRTLQSLATMNCTDRCQDGNEKCVKPCLFASENERNVCIRACKTREVECEMRCTRAEPICHKREEACISDCPDAYEAMCHQICTIESQCCSTFPTEETDEPNEIFV